MHNPSRILICGAAASALLVPILSAAPAGAHTKQAFQLVNVTVLDAKTVNATFSEPLDPAQTTFATFHAPHFDHDVPHSHNATAVMLLDGGHTAQVTLDRGLHSEDPPCDTDEPRCSDDELPFVVTNAVSVTGAVLSDDDWEVWAVGSDD